MKKILYLLGILLLVLLNFSVSADTAYVYLPARENGSTVRHQIYCRSHSSVDPVTRVITWIGPLGTGDYMPGRATSTNASYTAQFDTGVSLHLKRIS